MPEDQPSLSTLRLTLRPFELGDAANLQRLVGAREIADTTLTIPHPYPPGAAAEWIGKHQGEWEKRTEVTFAVIDSKAGELLGAIGLAIAAEHRRAELGYWIAVSHWGRGYATEASQGVLDFGFGALGLHRIDSRHFLRNPASGRVMQKLGMQYEGRQRDWAIRWDRFETLEVYAILEHEWRSRRDGSTDREPSR